MLLKQVKLKQPREPLQIPYPRGWAGDRSLAAFNQDADDDAEFYLSTEPRFLSVDEINLALDFFGNLPYPQQLQETGCVLIDQADSLLTKNHDELDAIEKKAGFPNSRKAKQGGTRSTYERVLLIRERGYKD